ncbi:hypothetical protein ACFQLX_05840 [Streptomyces polyrhachis]|uniref:Secreted protein n=1 Tax=Streptomyces polyrhachis TaxID=1282885 RepID=A0ABW2GEG6_9ACTN
MKSIIKKAAVTAGVGAAALVFATPASATPFPAATWTVTPASPSPLPVKGINTGNVVLTAGSIQLTCTAATATGTIASTTGNPGQLGTITTSTWGPTCTSPLGPVSVVHVGGWKLWGSTYDPAVGSGTTAGYLNTITANVTAGACKFTVIGKASGKYTNSTGALAVNSLAGELSVAASPAPVGCGAVITTATKPTFKGTYLVKVTNTTTIPKIVGS